MATDQRNILAFLSNDSDFQAWGQAIEAQLVACGMVVTADTGQVNQATMTRPGVTGTYAGYRMYRFSDTLQATKPVFLKVEYGVGGALDRPAMRVQLATATNGAGTLGGQVAPPSPQTLAAAASKTATTQLPSYCCGNGAGLRLVTNHDISVQSFRLAIFIERFRNGDGTANATGVFYYLLGSTLASGVLPYTGAIPTANSVTGQIPMVSALGSGSVTQAGSEVALFPMFGIWGRCYPLLGVVGYNNVELTAGISFTTSAWMGATTRTFMPFGSNGPTGVPSTNCAIAVLWE